MKSQGTKETQGINGDAALLQRRLAAVDLSAGSGAPCPYSDHRLTDWRLAEGGPVVCGVCHPPAHGLNIENVGEPSALATAGQEVPAHA